MDFSLKNSKSQFFDIIGDWFFSLFRYLQCCKMGKMRLFGVIFKHFINFPIYSRYVLFILTISQCLKITQNIAYEFFNLGISINFCPIEIGLSGSTVWPQASIFQNIAKLNNFDIQNETQDNFFFPGMSEKIQKLCSNKGHKVPALLISFLHSWCCACLRRTWKMVSATLKMRSNVNVAAASAMEPSSR